MAAWRPVASEESPLAIFFLHQSKPAVLRPRPEFRGKQVHTPIIRNVAILTALVTAALIAGCGSKNDATAGQKADAAKPAPQQPATPAAQPQGLPVRAEAVKVAKVSDDVSAVGSLMAEESVIIRPEIDGRIVGLHFQEGQAASAGTRLVTIDSTEYEAQAAAVSADLKTEEQRLVRTKELHQQGRARRSSWRGGSSQGTPRRSGIARGQDRDSGAVLRHCRFAADQPGCLRQGRHGYSPDREREFHQGGFPHPRELPFEDPPQPGDPGAAGCLSGRGIQGPGVRGRARGRREDSYHRNARPHSEQGLQAEAGHVRAGGRDHGKSPQRDRHPRASDLATGKG